LPDGSGDFFAKVFDPFGTQGAISGFNQLKHDLGLDGSGQQTASTPASAPTIPTLPSLPTASSLVPDLQTYEPPEVKTAKTAADNAKANLQEITDAAAQRQADFDVAHVGAEQQALSLKLQQTDAEQQLLGYKRQIEDIDRAAIDYAQQRKTLDDQDAVTKAKLAENPLSNQGDDLSYRENLLKAQITAARAGGSPIDTDAARQQLRDLEKQKAELQPSLLQAQHNVDLANRAQSVDQEQKSLTDNATSRAKIGVEESMQPLQDEVTARQRAAQDAQALLDLDKQRFQLSEMGYKTETLLAQAAQKAAEHTLFLLQNPVSATYGPNPVAAGPSVGNRVPSPVPDEDPNSPGNRAPVTVNIDVTHNADENSLLDRVVAELRSAWNAAMASEPVSHKVGGSAMLPTR
jgi:hypothetical protein